MNDERIYMLGYKEERTYALTFKWFNRHFYWIDKLIDNEDPFEIYKEIFKIALKYTDDETILEYLECYPKEVQRNLDRIIFSIRLNVEERVHNEISKRIFYENGTEFILEDEPYLYFNSVKIYEDEHKRKQVRVLYDEGRFNLRR